MEAKCPAARCTLGISLRLILRDDFLSAVHKFMRRTRRVHCLNSCAAGDMATPPCTRQRDLVGVPPWGFARRNERSRMEVSDWTYVF